MPTGHSLLRRLLPFLSFSRVAPHPSPGPFPYVPFPPSTPPSGLTSLPSALPVPSPLPPTHRRRAAQKTGPGHRSPPPPDSRRLPLAQATPQLPGTTSPTRAPLSAHATPRSVRRRPWPVPSPTRPKNAPPRPIRHSGVFSRNPVLVPQPASDLPQNAPPRLKSFLEKTLTRTNPPHLASQTVPPKHRPAPPLRPRVAPTLPQLRAQPR